MVAKIDILENPHIADVAVSWGKPRENPHIADVAVIEGRSRWGNPHIADVVVIEYGINE